MFFGIFIVILLLKQKDKRMKRWIYILNLLLVFGAVTGGWSQNRNLNQNLTTLKAIIERTASMLQLLPQFPNNDVINEIQSKLQNARTAYEQAVDFVRKRQNQNALMAIAQAYGFLKQVEALMNQHPVFRIKYQEILDQQLQRAEDLVNGQQDEEAFYMLNRAKFFRRRAYDLFRQGKTYAATEYYRLAIYFAEQVQHVLGRGGANSDREDWQKYYLDTEMLLERARSLVAGAGDQNQLSNMLKQAERGMSEVQRLYEEKNYTAARQKLQTIHRALFRIIDMAEQIPQNEEERLQMDLESVQFSWQSVNEKAGAQPSSAFQAISGRLGNLIRRTQLLIAQNQLEIARRNVFFANQMVLRLYRLAENQDESNPEVLRDQLARTKQNFSEITTQHSKNTARENFSKLISANLRQAEERLAQHQYLEASFYLKIANQLMLRFNRLQSQTSQLELKQRLVRQDMERLSNLLERLKESGEAEPEYQIRYQNAQELYHQAEQAFQSGDLYTASALCNMGIALLTQ